MGRSRLVRAAASAVVAILLASPLFALPASAEHPPSLMSAVDAQNLTSSPPSLESNAGHVVNATLTIKPGDWGPASVTLSYSWKRDGELIAGATSATYALASEDLHTFIQGFVTGEKEGYTALTRGTELIGPIRPAGMLTARSAAITGMPQVGSTLTATDGTWEPAPVTLTHQWLRDGESIPGATGHTYTLGQADLGTRISIEVTGSKPGYATDSQGSARTGVVQPEGFTLTVPTIAGISRVDETLTALPGQWTPTPDAFNYQWMRNGVPIAGATEEKYALTAADLGRSVAVVVSGAKEGLPTTSLTSAYSSVRHGVFASPVPTITGAPSAGNTLTVAPGDWTPGAALPVQWLRNGAPLDGATGTNYTLQRADIGMRMSVMVTGTKAGYFPYSTYALSTLPVSGSLKEFSGDGHADVLARDSVGRLWMYAGNTSGGWKPRTQVGAGWSGFTSILAPGDFNLDGLADVLARDTKGVLWMYPGDGSGGWHGRVPVGSGWNVMTSIIGPGDFNGDGNADVLARDRDGVLYLYPGHGWGGWMPRVKVGAGWNAFTSIVGPGDLNGDGHVDVLARASNGALWLYPGNGSGGWKTRVKVGSGWNGFTSIVGPGDFDSDGHVDVLARASNGALWLYPGNGSGGWKTRSQVGSGWNIFNSIL